MGSMQFDRQTVISATTSKSIQFLQGDYNGNLSWGVFEQHTIYAPKNTVCTIINQRMEFPPVSGANLTGPKDMMINNQVNANVGLGMFRVSQSNPAEDFVFGSYTISPNTSYYPNDLAAVDANIRQVVYDETIGVSIIFWSSITQNGAGYVITGNDRSWMLFVEQEVVAR